VLAPCVGISADFKGIVVGLHQAGICLTTLDRTASEAGQDLLRMIRRLLETARGLKDVRLWIGRPRSKGSKRAVAAQRSALDMYDAN